MSASPAAFRVALVGCGRISANHIEAIAKIDGLTLTAVCDTDPARARTAGERSGVPWYTDYGKMLAEAPIDLVTVATPSGLHPEHGILAARAGKHVISEKPMAISLDGADALMRACEEAGVKLFVVKQNRLNATIQLLRRAGGKGRCVTLYVGNAAVRWAR
ncbi:MAG: Gfo/Idh/MocA family protein, partial [Gemmatimonadota bacterium]